MKYDTTSNFTTIFYGDVETLGSLKQHAKFKLYKHINYIYLTF